jgi:predicted DCC family thiol-disulfide oxidoreductase YuxK
LTVWYDGACPLCIREIALMRRLDRARAIAFVDVAPADAPCPIDRQLLLARFHAQEAGGSVLNGAAAFAAMWRVILVLRPLGLVAQNGVVLRALEIAYRAFLEGRPRLQQWARRGNTVT